MIYFHMIIQLYILYLLNKEKFTSKQLKYKYTKNNEIIIIKLKPNLLLFIFCILNDYLKEVKVKFGIKNLNLFVEY